MLSMYKKKSHLILTSLSYNLCQKSPFVTKCTCIIMILLFLSWCCAISFLHAERYLLLPGAWSAGIVWIRRKYQAMEAQQYCMSHNRIIIYLCDI